MCMRIGSVLTAAAVIVLAQGSLAQAVTLAQDGEAQMPIVLGPELSDESVPTARLNDYQNFELAEVPSAERIRAAAETLAAQLQRISGAEFDIVTGDGRSGIALGVASDFPALDLEDRFDPDDVLRTEAYLIRSHDEGLYLIGATELAVEHAVWDLLHRLGYRQYFPGPTWEIVPDAPSLAIDVDSFETPDYHSRLIWYGTGLLDYNAEPYRRWVQRNRAVAGFRLNTGHEYNRIRSRNKEAFEQNPEFYAMVDGKHQPRSHAKFNVANPELRQLVIDDAIRWFENNPHAISKSMDPSDHSGWSEDGPSAEIGTPTDQALKLANVVAEAVNEHFDEEKYVGMYAYYEHISPPENVRPHPNVVISFATRFLRSRQTVDELISGWRERGLRYAGIRGYFSWFNQDRMVPADAFQGASFAYRSLMYPHYHQRGARFFTAEAADAWGLFGPGYYLSSRILWDVDEAERADQIMDEFLAKAFGPAREPMARFYERISGDQRPLARDNIVGHLYATLAEARELAGDDEAVHARLDDLAIYVRYLELYRAYDLAEGADRQAAFEQLIRHAYRGRKSMMIHLKPLYERNGLGGDPHVELPDEARWNVPEDENPWKSSEPYNRAALDAWIDEGVSRFAGGAGFAHADYAPLHASHRYASSPGTLRVRDDVAYLLHADRGDRVTLEVTPQLLDFSFTPPYMVLSPAGEIVTRGDWASVREEQRIQFRAPETGTYRITFDNSPNTIRLESEHPLGMLAQDSLGALGRIHFKRPVGRAYFYVPAGVERCQVKVAGQGDGELVDAALRDPAGEVVEQQRNISGSEPHRFTITRSDAAEGEVWSIEFDSPEDAYFGDVHVELDDALPPVMSMHPETVFTER
ncbi:MAG: DUF4838 domain-containing protein [Phycisphaeraceae bacterium]